MKLADYRNKRDPKATNEPFGPEPPERGGPTTAGAFVIHLHDASRTHYDLRMEMGGVLLSFAVPKGPSLDPAEKRLAVKTEDHPIDYLDFEAVIPAGQYGGGPMILWDRGKVRYLETSAEEGVDKGKIDFVLEGLKVRGRFALVRIKGGKDEWLLIKKADAFSRAPGEITQEKPRSILSGLSIDELAKGPAIARALEAKAAELGAPEAEVDGRKIVPMSISNGVAPDHGNEWIFELKLDGVRELATKLGDRVVLTNRKLRENSDTYPEVARAVRALPVEGAVLDGEIVAFDEQGQPSFQRLQHRIHVERARDVRRAMVDVPVVFAVFDLLAIGSRDLRSLPLLARKRLLAELIQAPGVLRVLDHIENDGRPLLAFCKERRLEGIVAKRKDSVYRAGPRRSDEWMKMKCEREDDFVVVGWTRGERVRDRMGAVDVASFEGGDLVYRGKVGSGLDDRVIATLRARLDPIASKEPAAKGVYAPAPKGRTHARPELVVRVRFTGFTDGAQLLRPVFLGLRDDVSPTECTARPPRDAEDDDIQPVAAEEAPPSIKRERTAAPEPELPAITNRKKVLWPDDGYTKEDLCGYYAAIAPAMLKHLEDRPVMLVRYPDGIAGKSFYQWNVPPGTPDWIRTCRIIAEDDREMVEVFLLDDARSLVYVANLAAIPIHVLAGRVTALEKCDFLTLDFDVQRASLAAGIELARSLHDILDTIGLEGFPKTSGQTGLHVFVPLGENASYDTARMLADVLGRILVQRHPTLATMDRVVSRRGTKVYVDTGQTGPTRTIVAPYAVRAYRGARVSAPLAWDEVAEGLNPQDFDIRTVPERFKRIGDPMAGLLKSKPDVARAVERLSPLVR